MQATCDYCHARFEFTPSTPLIPPGAGRRESVNCPASQAPLEIELKASALGKNDPVALD